MGFGPPMGKLASPRLNAVLRSRSTKVAKSALPLVRPIWGWRRLSLEVILLSGQIGHDMKSLAYGSDFWYVSYLRSRRSSTMLTWGPSSIYPLWGTNFVGFKQGLNNRKTTTYLWWLTPNKVQFFDSGMKIFFSGGQLLQCVPQLPPPARHCRGDACRRRASRRLWCLQNSAVYWTKPFYCV